MKIMYILSQAETGVTLVSCKEPSKDSDLPNLHGSNGGQTKSNSQPCR